MATTYGPEEEKENVFGYPSEIIDKGVPYLKIKIFDYPTSGHIKEASVKLMKALTIVEGGLTAQQVEDLKKLDDAVKKAGSSYEATALQQNAAKANADPVYRTSKATFLGRFSKAKATINIYIPEGLNYNASAKWENEEIIELAAASQGTINFAKAVTAAAANGVKQSLDGGFTGKVASELKFTSGLALNLKDRLLFQGSDSQVMQLKFELYPQSGGEAQMVNNIINALKAAAMPSVVGTNENILMSPSLFSFEIVNTIEDKVSSALYTVNNILGEASKAMALTNIVIKPNIGDGQSFYANGNAVGYDVDLTFKSIFKVFKG